MRAGYDAMIETTRAAYSGYEDVTISMVMPFDTFWVYRDFGAFSQVMADLGIGVSAIVERAGEERFEASAEALPDLDADFVMLSYVPGDPEQGTPAQLRERMAALVPDWCAFLHACRNNQVLYLPREAIYASSFASLREANAFLLAHVAGRDFVPFEE
jgi:iron complex transport system substrate-binding protein